ncbi:MAG: CPBP family intramembrane metalloprotease [Tannerellaceae bacterium]|nr:CPBP family intramembrane metalloprotease [Tannerellaceae bacterium]
MRLKGLFADRTVWEQLFLLLCLVLVGSVVGGLFGSALYVVAGGKSHIWATRLLQLVMSGAMFLLPALLMARLCSERISGYLSLRLVKDVRIWIVLFIVMMSALPIINVTAYLNSLLRLPAFMSPVEEWMLSMERETEVLMASFFSDSGIWAYLGNMLVIALCPGAYEEFFFRGALQRVLERKVKNPHTVIWLTAFIFGFIHFQFYGLLPRMLLGAYFGYILYWTRSLWLAVFAHFINNAIAVTGMSMYSLKDLSIVKGGIPAEEILPYLIITPVSLMLLFVCTRYVYMNRARD